MNSLKDRLSRATAIEDHRALNPMLTDLTKDWDEPVSTAQIDAEVGGAIALFDANTREDVALVAGGQGRSDEEVSDLAARLASGATLIAAAGLAVLIVWAGWEIGGVL